MPRHCVRWQLALLMAVGLVLALASGLAACGGASDGEVPPAATEVPPQTAVVVDSPAADPPSPLAETTPTPVATPEPSAQPVEPAAPDPPTSPARVAPEPATGPTELPTEVSTSPAETTSAESVTSPPIPAPHPGVALIEPAPGAFEQRTFATGERIEWTHGIFVLDPETGETEGYRAPAAGEPGNYYRSLLGGISSNYPLLLNGWIHVEEQTDLYLEPFTLLLDRATGQSWRWPSDHLRLAAASSEHLLFEERTRSGDGRSTGRFTIVNRAMEEVGRFSIDGAVDRYRRPVFSPDGQIIALSAGDTAYLVPVKSPQPVVLFKADATDREASVWIYWRYEGPSILVLADYETESGDIRRARHDFSWEGAPLPAPAPACQAPISPDGRYVAWLVGGDVARSHVGVLAREDPWPSVVIADAATCAPLFRVRSAYTYDFSWGADWLPTSDGFVVGVRDGGYMIARVHPTPSLIRLPDRGASPANPSGSGGASHHFFYVNGRRAGPEPAPTGDGRYFGYGPGVYDAIADRWFGSDVDSASLWKWGRSHRERWFGLYNEAHGWYRWLLLPPKIEFPPFSDAIAFRVAGTGSCLRLRAAPGEDSETTDCLPDGERLVLTEPNASPHDPEWLTQPHPAVDWTQSEGSSQSTWVHVRTAAGAEGWVSHDYLEHD